MRSAGLVGRDKELAILRRALMTPGTVVVLEGEAGVGKSRLLAELVERPGTKTRLLVGSCYPFTSTFPLGPVVEALRSLKDLGSVDLDPVCGSLNPIVPELAHLLPPPLDPLGDTGAARHRVFRAIADLLGCLDQATLVIEDIHWADPVTVELVAFLAARPDNGFSLIYSFRDEDLSPTAREALLSGAVARAPQREAISLEPFDERAVGELVTAILDTDSISDEFVTYLYEKTSGLPFAVEELLHLLSQRRDIRLRDGAWERRAVDKIEVPPAIRDATLERVQRLTPHTRALLSAASMFERPVAEEVLERVAGIDGPDFERSLSAALESGLLQEVSEATYAFRHVLARDAVHDSLTGPDRRNLHERAARALEASQPARLYDIAFHYKCARNADRWIDYAMRFADGANSFTDTEPALGLLRAALSERDLPNEVRSRLAIKLGQTALRGLAHEEALKTLTDMADDGSLPRSTRAEIRYQAALLWDSAGDASACYREISVAVADLGHDPALQAVALSGLGLPWAPEVPADRHLAWLEEADRVATGIPDFDRELSLRHNKATTLLYLGSPEAWSVASMDTWPSTLWQKKEFVRAVALLAPAAFFGGWYFKAEELLDRAEEIARADQLDRFDGMMSAARLLLDWGRGHISDLEARARHLIDSPNVVPCFSWAAHLVLGGRLAARGRTKTARTHLSAAFDIAPGAGSLVGGVCAAAQLARLLDSLDDRDAAHEVITEAAQLLDRKGVWLWGADLCTVAVDTCDRGIAETMVGKLSVALASSSSSWAEAALAYSEGRLAEAKDELGTAVARWTDAALLWDALPRPHEAARAREAAGTCLLRADEDGGADLLEAAARTYAEIGAAVDANRVRSVLREHGVYVNHRRGRKSYGEELSPREREVALLISEGHSNRDIAGLLCLSPRTVEDHVARAMRKLGVGSRVDLGRELLGVD